MFKEKFLATRHSIKPKAGSDSESLEYEGVSERGVELARERATELLDVLEKEPIGTVMFLAGASDLARTKSAAKIYSEEMSRLVDEKKMDDIEIISLEEYVNNPPSDSEKPGYTQIAADLAAKIKSAPDKKFLVDMPLFIKEFVLGHDRWYDQEGKMTDYAKDLLARNNNNEEASLQDWIKNSGRSGDLVGPDPVVVAKEHLTGIERLANFARKHLGEERSLLIGSVAHSWNLDAMGVYLVNNGRVDLDGYNRLGGEMIKETQLMRIGENADKQLKLFYRGGEYDLNSDETIEQSKDL